MTNKTIAATCLYLYRIWTGEGRGEVRFWNRDEGGIVWLKLERAEEGKKKEDGREKRRNQKREEKREGTGR
jgi:hypothetical protein